jgi:2-phospho-L-lactate guanylyltransferase (CobY/MobA/RfbA family)
MQAAYADGAEATLFLPGDLPLITGDDVGAVITASDHYAATVCVRAASDGGTNALLQPASTAFEPLLGERSFEKHCDATVAAGATLVTPGLPRVAFDLDTRADYEWAKENVAGFAQSVYDWENWLRGARTAPLPGVTH